MAKLFHISPVPLTRKGRFTAAAFAAAMVCNFGQPVCAQDVEVEVMTTGTQAGAQVSSAPAAAQPEGQVYQADKDANKIVPAPGTLLQSTSEATLGGSNAIAPAPSVQINEGGLQLQEGETTETVAVRSGAELLKLLNVQLKNNGKKPAGGTELEEDTTNSLFDVAAVERLKGEKPTVVYRVVVDNTPIPDPMIVPWIRQAKLLQERFDKAVALLAANNVVEGKQELLAIVTEFPDSDYALQSRELLKKLDDLKGPAIPQPIKEDKTTVTVEISPNIQIGTVIVDPADPNGNRVMVNGRIYKVGDEIRQVPGHKVVGIAESVVQIEVEQSGLKQTFDVPVRPTGTNQ